MRAITAVIFVFCCWLVLSPLGGQEKKPAKVLKHTELDLGGSTKMKLVYIEPGKFMMGQGRFFEFQHEVEITKGFYMGVFEVTQQEYTRVIGENPSLFYPGDRVPVNSVSWEAAINFCEQLSKKTGKTIDLPTEAEWEYACRAGCTGPFHYGNSLSSKQANFDGKRPYGGADEGPFLEKMVPVGSYEPNAFGLYDMHGNAEEWCKDWFSDDYYKNSPPRDPQGPATGTRRVLRGGHWCGRGEDCRSAARYSCWPDLQNGNLGFRVVLRLP